MALLTVALLLVAAVTSLALGIASLMPWSQADRFLLASVILAASTVVLAVLAGLVAVTAYAAATQRPDLEIEITFRFSSPNEPVLAVEPPDQFGARAIAPWRQCEATVRIRNRSSYSARNPAVRIDLIGMGGIGESTGWTAVHFVNTVGPTGVQWEGGADYSIHGNWTRELPALDFAGVRVYAMPSAELRVELVADGFRSETRIPVRLLEPDAYTNYTAERAKKVTNA